MSIEHQAYPANQPETIARKERLVRTGFQRWVVACALALALLAAPMAAAEDSPARKLGRGAANVGLGIFAIPDVMIETTKERGPALGMTWGLIKGTGVMLATEAVGLFEIVTCPFATPPNYRQILDPEFPWQRFTGGGKKKTPRKGRIAREGGRRVRE